MVHHHRTHNDTKQERKMAGDRTASVFISCWAVLMAGLVIALIVRGIYYRMGQGEIFTGFVIGMIAGALIAAAPTAIYYAYATWRLPPDEDGS